jgi:hypothetical protein
MSERTNERIYSAVEAAREVGVSDTWVRNQIKQGLVLAKRQGRLYVISEDQLPELRRLAESNERTQSERTNEDGNSFVRSLEIKVERLENERRLLQDVIDRQHWILAQEAKKCGEEVAMLRAEITQLEARLALPNPERTNSGWFRSFVRKLFTPCAYFRGSEVRRT